MLPHHAAQVRGAAQRKQLSFLFWRHGATERGRHVRARQRAGRGGGGGARVPERRKRAVWLLARSGSRASAPSGAPAARASASSASTPSTPSSPRGFR
jgi:hypothetical protein